MQLTTRVVCEEISQIQLTDQGVPLGKTIETAIITMVLNEDIPGRPHSVELQFSEAEAEELHRRYQPLRKTGIKARDTRTR